MAEITEAERKVLVDTIVAWVNSTEGRAQLEESQRRVEATLADLREKRRIDPAILRIPMSI